MKKLLALIFVFVFSFTCLLNAQLVTKESGGYQYQTLESDPIQTRIYTLNNGLIIYLSVNKNVPRIQTYIAVRAGSKYDPADATGLAHYLEHLMFKGTANYGTYNYEKEKLYLNKIVDLFEIYRETPSAAERINIYHQIDSISQIASTLAIANEYDKMLSLIGAKGTNAWTSFEQTVYTNDIPSNQLERWLYIESERFSNAVFRLFHTELEVVYEEKNIDLDNGDSKAWDALLLGLFPKHQYGTQTTIGRVEHLKNPSLKKVIEYYKKYYVPGNMAVCLSGDLNPDETVAMIDKYWGGISSGAKNDYLSVPENEIKSVTVKEVFSQESESLYLGYRYPGSETYEAEVMTMISNILYNGNAGLIDINLNQSQKVLNCSAFELPLKDYSMLIFNAQPREGQSLEEVKNLILSQIEIIKKGDFPDWLINAIINDMKLQTIKAYEENYGRAGEFVNAFTLGTSWDKYNERIYRISKITKQEIIDYANKIFNDNYVIVYKKTGDDKNATKITKPQITPAQLNRTEQSDFFRNLTNIPVSDIKPVFLDFKNDFQTSSLDNNIPLYYKKNESNKLFQLYYVFPAGTNNDKLIKIAVDYLPYLGTSQLTPAEVKQEFYKLGCSFSVFSNEDETYVTLTGLDENFVNGIKLFEELLNDAQANETALKNMISDILKVRENNKLDKNVILWSAMFDYGTYGVKSPYKNIYSAKELENLKPSDVISFIKKLTSYSHEVIYYGSKEIDEVKDILKNGHIIPDELAPVPKAIDFTALDNKENVIYVVNYKDMKQAEIVMLSKGVNFEKSLSPVTRLYNEYFGSIIFQELRESKALAYSVYSSYSQPVYAKDPYILMSYIGTQTDKIDEAFSGFYGLLNDLPKSEVTFNASKKGVLELIQTDRITKANIIFRYLALRKLGIDYDLRKDNYEKISNFSFDDIKKFASEFIKGKKYTILVLADKEKLDLTILKKYGRIEFLEMDKIFGY